MTSKLLGAPVTIGDSRDTVVRAAAEKVLRLATETNLQALVVSGGATTPLVLSLIARLWNLDFLPTLVVSDERHSGSDEDRNDLQLREMVTSTRFADCRIESPRYGRDAFESARAWSLRLQSLPRPDVAILSMADDGHIAGLFPTVDQVPVSDVVIVCEASPKPPSTRISLSSSYLKTIPHRLVTVAGENKLSALSHVANGDELPTTLVRPTEWFIESSLWSELRH